MTQRERQSPNGGNGPAAPLTPYPAGHRPPPLYLSRWEAFCLQAPTAERDRLVALAAANGGTIPANRIPEVTPAVLVTPAEVLAGANLPAVCPATVSPHDSALDPDQREAVSRALSTTDLCLIQGLPGTGKSRVVTEILRQVVSLGGRALLLAPGAAAVDRALLPLAGEESCCPLRVLAPDEAPESLTPAVRRLTVAERERTYCEKTVAEAVRTVERRAARCSELSAATPVWDRLDAVARRDEALASESTELSDRLRRSESADSGGLYGPGAARNLESVASERDAACTRVDERATVVREQLAKVRAELETVSAEESALIPIAEARESVRFWTVAWWRGLSRPDATSRVGVLSGRRGELWEVRQRLEAEAEALDGERVTALRRFAEEYRRITDGERERHRAEVAAEAARITAERESLDGIWRATLEALPSGVEPPRGRGASDVALARSAWEVLLREEESRRDSAREWAGATQESARDLASRILGLADVVGAPLAALGSEPFAAGEGSGTFDLLVLEEAERITETEFLQASAKARRWVLVGEPSDSSPEPDARALLPAALRTGVFQRLWRRLHPDPSRLPYRWSNEAGRLRCRLRPVPPDRERWLESEQVADRPDVELRILATPRTTPELVEVVFPANTPVADAKAFLLAEVGDFAVQAGGAAFRWSAGPGRTTIHFAPDTPTGAERVEPTPGVSEVVSPAAPRQTISIHRTYEVSFDYAAGWSRARAEQWVHDRLGLLDRGRTAVLNAPRRMAPGLARFLSALLFDGGYSGSRNTDRAGEQGPCVEFVAVPSLDLEPGDFSRPGGEGRRRLGGTATASPRARTAKGGAGYEVDLAAPRRLEPLPVELRGALPPSGLVNLPEAQAVVRFLEDAIADPGFRAAAVEWQKCRAGEPALFVTSPFHAQAVLIERLLQRSPALASAPVVIESLPAPALAQREAWAVLVSLTRSHPHRAVSFGPSPGDLPLALTRACGRLVLFGDPGTLARRGQWDGPLDRLDAGAAARERGLVSHLLAYLHGRGPHADVFRLRAGGPS